MLSVNKPYSYSKIVLIGIFTSIFSTLFFQSTSYADTSAFGGYIERFKGAGDRVPPQCVVDIPSAAASPFFIKWNCEDDESMSDELRSEVWIYRNGEPRGFLAGSFIGFPASLFVDEAVAREETFTNSLPLRFRLIVRDRAGLAAVSPFIVVSRQDNSVDECSLFLATEATLSDGSTTGIPSLVVSVDDSTLDIQSDSTSLSVNSLGSEAASTCEITSVCEDDDNVSFSGSFSLDSLGNASGTLSISPGSPTVSLSGTATLTDSILERVQLSGTTIIDDLETTVTLDCSK